MRPAFGIADTRRRRGQAPGHVKPAALLPRDMPHPIGAEVFAPIALADAVKAHLKPVEYEGDSPMKGRLHTVPDWEKWGMAERLAFLRSFVEDTARDPMIAKKANDIVRAARVPTGNYRGEWAALLKWVQTRIRFTAEPNERIQSPQYTLTEKFGDCDDLGVLLAALGHSRRLPFKFTLSGRDMGGKRVRWVEGDGNAPRAAWTHIYVLSQWPPFRPTKSAFAEPTLDVPLGWDALRDAPPRNRADLGADEPEKATEGAGVVKKQLAILAKTQAIAAKLPWITIAGSVVGTVLSYVVVQGVVAPRLKKKR